MLYLGITFDYELFLGENYKNEEEVLIKPTEKISKMLSGLGISATFFADVCCPMRYRELGKDKFPEMFDAQLQQLMQMGHDVQLHIHPNWLKASSVGEKVIFNKDFYRIHNFANENDYSAIEDIVKEGCNYLDVVLKKKFPNYKCIAYRAGGYCLQPEQEISRILYDNGIRIDSSVCCGKSYIGGGMYYDYRKVNKTPNFYFNHEIGLLEKCKNKIPNGIFEIPVGSYKKNPFKIIASKMNAPITTLSVNGCAMKLDVTIRPKNRLKQRIKNCFIESNMLTLDSYNYKSMVYMVKHLLKDHNCKKKDIYLTIIAHPKMQSDDHIENMKKTCELLLKEKYVVFSNLSDMAKNLELI